MFSAVGDAVLSDADLGSVFGLAPSIMPVNIASLDDDPMMQRLRDMDVEALQLHRQMLLEQQECVPLTRRDSKGARPGSKTKTPPRPNGSATRLPASTVSAPPFDIHVPASARVERGNIAAELLPVRAVHVDSQHVGRLPAYEIFEVATEGAPGSMDISFDTTTDAPGESPRDNTSRAVRRVSSGWHRASRVCFSA